MAENKTDLASIIGLLLKACPILKENMPHPEWLEYLHTARCAAGKLKGGEHDTAAKAAGCDTLEEAIRTAEHISDRAPHKQTCGGNREGNMKDNTVARKTAEDVYMYLIGKETNAVRLFDTEPPVVVVYGIKDTVKITFETKED